MQEGTSFSSAKLAITLLAIALSGAGHQLIAQNTSAANANDRKATPSPETREHVKKVIPAIGLVLVRNANEADQKPRPRGSAVIVRKDGLVITNFHVVARDKSTKLYDEIFLSLPPEPGVDATAATRQVRLTPVLTNQERDLALLRVTPEKDAKPDAPAPIFPWVEIGESSKMELLDDLFIIGFPEKGGTTVTVNFGVVEGKDALDEWIKTDARIIHGNSGGAAVNGVGKLIGIPTRVVSDSDSGKTYGSVGYLRPAYLVAAMISKYQEAEMKAAADKAAGKLTPTIVATNPTPVANNAANSKAPALLTVRGLVKSVEGKPLGGVRVGLLLVGEEVAAASIITWGGTNAEGQFELEKPVPPGRYNLRAKVVGYDLYSIDLDLSSASQPIAIELKPTSRD